MKISKTALLVLGIGIFIIAFATLYTMYSGQSGERAQLNDSLAKAQTLLPQLVVQREDLEGQLTQSEERVAEASSSLTKSEARFPKSAESIEYDETLFRIADDCDLQVVELTASEPEDKKVEDIIYTTTTFEVKVRSKELPPSVVGEFEIYIDETVANMLKFINAIATGEEFNVGTIEGVVMEGLEIPEEITGDETGPEATVKFNIYGFPR